MTYRTSVITTPDDAVIAAWRDLWHRTAEADPFTSPDFFAAMTRRGGRRRIIVCHDAHGTLCGVLTLATTRIHGVRGWATPGWHDNRTDHAAFLDGGDQRVGMALIRAAASLGPVVIGEVPAGTPAPRTALRVDTGICPYRRLDPTTDHLDRMPRHQRRTLLSRLRRYGDRLTFTMEKGVTALETARIVERHSDRDRRLMRFFDIPANERFLSDLTAAPDSMLRVGIVRLDGVPVAAVTGLLTGTTFATYHMAFDERYRGIGPGKIAFHLLLQHLAAAGITRVDFLRGNSPFKRQFAEDVVRQEDLYLASTASVRLWWRAAVVLLRWRHSLAAAVRRHIPQRLLAPDVIFSSYDSVGHPVYGGGGAIAIHETARRLVRTYGLRVTVIAGRYPGSGHVRQLDGVRYVHVGTSLLGPRLGQILFVLATLLHAALRRYGVWCENFTPPLSISPLPLVARSPVIGLAHMLAADDMYRRYHLPLHALQNHGLRWYRTVVATSDAAAAAIRWHMQPDAMVAVIPPGIDTVAWRRTHGRDRERYIAFVGRIAIKQKGLDLLLAAYAGLPADRRMPLRIAGGGAAHEIRRLRQLIARYGLSGQVTLLGRIGPRRRASLLGRAWLAVVPSRFETFGMTALEALAAGTPTVILPIPGMSWIPEECVIRAARTDATALTEALRRGMMETETRRAVAAAGRDLAGTYDWDAVAARYAALIDARRHAA